MRSTRSSLLAVAVLALLAMLPLVTGCENGQGFRSIDAVNAEKACLSTTEKFADCYIEKHPDEAQQVKDFYASWAGRLEKEAAAAGQ